MSGPVNYDGIALTKLYLFGTTDVPADFNLRVRDEDAEGATFSVDTATYFTSGPGRFAWPSRANIVEDFFNSNFSSTLAAGTYSLEDLITHMTGHGYTFESGDVFIPIYNYGTEYNSADHPERSYIFGTSGVTLQGAQFTVAGDGSRSMSNIVLSPNADNFDFHSSEAQFFNNIIEGIVDPYELGVTVDISFTQNSYTLYQTGSYTQADFEADELREDAVVSTSVGVLANLDDITNYAYEYLFDDEILAYKEAGRDSVFRDVIYISPFSSQRYSTENSLGILVGNSNSNSIFIYTSTQNEVYAAGGDDFIYIMNVGGHFVDGFDGDDWVGYDFAPQHLVTNTYERTDGVDVFTIGNSIFVAEKVGGASPDELINIEFISLTAHDDNFTVTSSAISTFSGLTIDARGELEGPDILDARSLSADVSISLGGWAGTSGIVQNGADHLIIQNFENVVSGSGNDLIEGSNRRLQTH